MGLVERIRALRPNTGVALATQTDLTPWPARWSRFYVPPFTEKESADLLESFAGRAGPIGDSERIRQLILAGKGSPGTLATLARLVYETSVDEALARLRDRLEANFPGPELPGGSASAAARELDIRVSAVNAELIRRLIARPELMYELRPRQFEELMAELFERQGFDVELTKQTRDGGVDLYLIQHTPAGRLLTLVDAKRNAPDRPVGVGVVRQLYGVVEAQKASAGLVATTSFFSPDAKKLQEEIPFRLALKDYLDLQTMLRSAAGN